MFLFIKITDTYHEHSPWTQQVIILSKWLLFEYKLYTKYNLIDGCGLSYLSPFLHNVMFHYPKISWICDPGQGSYFAISDLLVLALCSNVCNSICPSLPGSLLTKHLTWAFVTRHHSIIYYSSWRTDFGSQSTVYMTCCSDTTAYVLSPAFSTRIAIICETFQLTRIYWQRCGQVLGFLEGESLHVKLLKITTSWTVAKCFNCQICPVSFQCQVTPIMITYSTEYIQTLSSFQSWNTPFATPIRPVQIVTRGRLLVANSIKFRIYPLFITYSSWL